MGPKLKITELCGGNTGKNKNNFVICRFDGFKVRKFSIFQTYGASYRNECPEIGKNVQFWLNLDTLKAKCFVLIYKKIK